MKQEILNIISKKYVDIFYLDEVLKYAEKLINSLENCTNQTETSFLSFLKKYNFETIEKFSEYPEYPSVTLAKNQEDWTLAPVIDYEGGITTVDMEIGIIFTDPEIYFDGEDEFEIIEDLKVTIVLTWLSLMWFRIEGYSYGVVVKTLENNSCSCFFFNDLAWDNLSNYINFNNKNERLKNHFAFDLDVLTIYQRVSLITYPVKPYINKWRFFTNGNETKAFVRYGNETGEKEVKSIATDLEIIEHKTLFDTLKYEQTRSLEFLDNGFREFLFERNSLEPIYEGAIETNFHSGENWYYSEQRNRLDIKEIVEFENKNKLKLPFHFRHYLRLFNGRKYNNINMCFKTGKNFIRMKEFYDFTELKKFLNVQYNFLLLDPTSKIIWIDIGIIDDGNILSLNILTSKLAFKKNDLILTELDIDFETFIRYPKNYT